jgi:amino acid transporter
MPWRSSPCAGAGVFVTTGYVAAHVAGPGVILSYIAAGISALLSSFCYSEVSFGAGSLPYALG